MTTIGDRIHARRKHLDMTQEALSAKVGVTKATINKYESGVVINLRRPIIEKLASALDCSPSYLMGWEDNSVTVSGTNNNVVNHSAHVNLGASITQEESELLRIYRALPVKARLELLSTAFALEEKNDQ